MRRTYRQDKETGKFVEVYRETRRISHSVTDEIQPFISPVDGTVISTKKALQAHNRRNGVTNDLDSLREKTQRVQERQAAPIGNLKQDLIKSYDFLQHNPHLSRR